MKIKLGVSNRHVHVSKKDLDILFGKELEVFKNLVQPGEFASSLLVTLKTDKDIISNVRVLGPTRNYTQVEVSLTDAYKLGLKPPVRDSGDLQSSSPITIIGPKGEVYLENSCIIAKRHIHITPELVNEYNLEGIEKVSVKVDGEKGGILNNVYLKVSANYALELHLDTDDANAFMLKTGDELEIIK
jgi:putative phosphotransacetylase